MATKSKGKKKSSSKPKTASRAEMIEESSAAKRQVISVLLFTFSAFLFLAAIIKGESGWLVIHNCILGIFGFFGYGVPFLLGAVAVFLALDKLHGKTLQRCLNCRRLRCLSRHLYI